MIGIIGSMDLEIDPLAELMTEKTETVIAKMKYISGKIHGKDVVLSICGMGKVLAAISTQNMINRFNPDVILNIGVGGSTSEKLHVYDIAISDRVIQHDIDLTPIGYRKAYNPDNDVDYIDSDKSTRDAIEKVLKKLNVNYLVGTIASGDQFIDTNEQKLALNKQFGSVACEMEGASVGTVCYSNDVPFCIVRSISDELNGVSGVEFHTFKAAAAKRGVDIVSEFIKQF